MTIVSPYRPFAPESDVHRHLGPFDWRQALALLDASCRQACGCGIVSLTDATTELPVAALRFPTEEPRLMLWILEVSLSYLQSDQFDQDTVFITPDVLVVGDLRPYFQGDLTLLVRTAPKYVERPILNALQWWPVAAKAKLQAFYGAALAIARTLPPDVVCWGADSESLRVLVDPIRAGVTQRAGLRVALLESTEVLWPLTSGMMATLDAGGRLIPWPGMAAMDFRGVQRKAYMGRVWQGLAA